MNNIIIPSLSQLLGQSPVLLVYLIGLILALVFWRRCPTPSLLVLVATVLLLLISVIQPFVTQFLIHARFERGWTNQTLGWMISAVALTSSCFRAAAMGLLIAAVFFQRGVPRSTGPNKSVERPAAVPTVR
ncbi:MAG TPA: hypothetical protein VLW52_11975 [Opitutaceae bacterium]|nr:hypothetical protein [Opitutaceae bacterium]